MNHISNYLPQLKKIYTVKDKITGDIFEPSNLEDYSKNKRFEVFYFLSTESKESWITKQLLLK